VCAGLARRYGAPVFLVRVLMIAFALTGFGLVAYLALWVLMPSDR
jgi:phage shock protein PspC (stress-responsive transcriptional regulator)